MYSRAVSAELMKRLLYALCLVIASELPIKARYTDQTYAAVPCELGPGTVAHVVNVNDTTYAVLGAGGRFALVDRKNRRVMTTTCLPDQTAVIRCITATNSGYVVGTSNGSVWQFLDNEWISRELPSARACDAVTVWRNKIYVADSDGVVWGLQANGEWQEEYRSPHPLHDFVASQEHLFVVGDSSTIAKTIDTQRGFDVVVPPDSIARFMCGVALGDEILLGADKGTMYRYHVGTSAWSSVRVFHRFYNRSVRANAPRDLPGMFEL